MAKRRDHLSRPTRPPSIASGPRRYNPGYTFERIADMRLEGEDADGQNAIGALTIEADDRFTTVHFSPCYGLAGYIKAESVTVQLN